MLALLHNLRPYDHYNCLKGAQLSKSDRAAGCISSGQKWKTGTGRQYFTDIIGLSKSHTGFQLVYQSQWPWVTLNVVMAVIWRYLTEFGSFESQLYAKVADTVRNKKVAKSLFLAIYCMIHDRCFCSDFSRKLTDLIFSLFNLCNVQHCAAILATSELLYSCR